MRSRGRARRVLTEADFAVLRDERFQARFWSRVEKIDGGCWMWRGPLLGRGYGAVQVPRYKNPFQAHIIVAFWKHGRWMRPNEETRHACPERLCVNPDHLAFVVYSLAA